MSKDTSVDFLITLTKGKLEELEMQQVEYGCNALEKQFKLFTTLTTGNMHLFDADDKLKKYERVEDIIDEYFTTRLKMYQMRKDHMLKFLEKELRVLKNKTRYIQETIDSSIDLRKKTRETIEALLENRGFERDEDDADYRYLTRMPMDSVTEENVTKLTKDFQNKQNEVNVIQAQTPSHMWSSELSELETEYRAYKEERERQQRGEIDGSKAKSKTKVKTNTNKTNAKV
jgi:DNA topoisomerase-2